MLNSTVPKIRRIAPELDPLLYGGNERTVRIAILDALAPQAGINRNYYFATGKDIEELLSRVSGAAKSMNGPAIVMAPEARDRAAYDAHSTVTSRYSKIIAAHHPAFKAEDIKHIDRREWYGLAGDANFVIGTEDQTPYGNILLSVTVGGPIGDAAISLPPELIKAMLYSGHGNRVAICGGRSPLAKLAQNAGREVSANVIKSDSNITYVVEALTTLWDPDSDYEHVSSRVPSPLAYYSQSHGVPRVNHDWAKLTAAQITTQDFEFEIGQWWTVAIVITKDDSDMQVLLTNGVTKPHD